MRLRFPVCFSNRDSGMTDWFKEQKVTAHCNVREREVIVCSITSPAASVSALSESKLFC